MFLNQTNIFGLVGVCVCACTCVYMYMYIKVIYSFKYQSYSVFNSEFATRHSWCPRDGYSWQANGSHSISQTEKGNDRSIDYS